MIESPPALSPLNIPVPGYPTILYSSRVDRALRSAHMRGYRPEDTRLWSAVKEQNILCNFQRILPCF